MPGAGKGVKCPLCKDLAKHGKVTRSDALLVLNAQRTPERTRTCPGCKLEVHQLVTRKGVTMCEGCAVDLDSEEGL